MKRGSILCLVLVIFSGSALPQEADLESNLRSFIETYEDRYAGSEFFDWRGEGVIWAGKKNGFQPEEPYIGITFFKLTGDGLAAVVAKDDYQDVFDTWRSLKVGEKLEIAGFQYQMILWKDFVAMHREFVNGLIRVRRPEPEDLVCVKTRQTE